MSEQFVVVGAGLAGAKAVETLRAEGFDAPIVLVGAETERPYHRPPLSKDFLLGKQPRESGFVHDAGWYADNDVTRIAGVPATSLDLAGHTVILGDGRRLGYAKLLLATGSSPRTLEVPGTRYASYLRTLADSEYLSANFVEGAHVVIIGGGWIGLETAAAARARGCHVTVIELSVLPMQRVLGVEVARLFVALHEANGVTFRCGTSVRELRGSDVGGTDRVSSVVLPDGTELPADVVVAGLGIWPNVELAAEAGLDVHNGVLTDASLRTSDPDVYACGDVASSLNPLLGKRIRVEHWANALNGGPAAARAMLGREVVYDRVPYFYSDQYDLGMEYAGYVEPGGYDRVVFRGDPASGEYLAFWTSGGRVLAGMNANIWDVQDDIQRLVRAGFAGRPVNLTRLADPGVPLADVLPAEL